MAAGRVRTYAAAHLIDIIDSSTFFNGTGGPPNSFNASGSGSDSGIAPDGASRVTLSIALNGVVPYGTLFPTIPINALIVELRLTNGISEFATGAVGGIEEVSILWNWAISIGAEESSDSGFTALPNSNSHTLNITPEIVVPFDPPISRADLITFWSNVTIANFVQPDVVGEETSSVSASNSTTDWQLVVTFNDGPFSWYIKPTEVIVGGLPVSIIANPDTDIIQIPIDENGNIIGYVPKGFEFYATDEEFPDELIFYWWETNDVYLYYINSQIRPGPNWTLVSPGGGLEPPVCPTCRSLTLRGLDILVADVSGIYTLVPRKKNDTLYVRDEEETINVKIPNPSAKTGFVP